MSYERFNNEILPALHLPPMSRAILLAFRNADVKAEGIAEWVEANPYYLDALRRKWLSSTQHREGERAPLPRTEHLLVQLGMEGSRNFLIALQAQRSAGGAELDPSLGVRHAIRAESQAGLILGENPAIAYAGGLLFDLLSLRPASAEVRAFSEASFEQGLKAAQIASALGRRLPELELKRYLFGAALIQSAGKALLAHLEPEFVRFEQRCVEKALPPVVSEFTVRKRFGVSPAVLSTAACMALGVFRKAERPLLFCEQPYLLRSEPRAIYLFSAALRLALNIARDPQRIEQDTDPRIERWKGLELRELPISHAELAEISRKL